MTVTISVNINTASRIFTFEAPVVSGAHVNVPHTGGSQLTVTGLNFGAWEFTASLKLFDRSCHTASWSSDTTMSCHTNALEGNANVAVLTMQQIAGTGFDVFTFDSAPLMDLDHVLNYNA